MNNKFSDVKGHWIHKTVVDLKRFYRTNIAKVCMYSTTRVLFV